MKYLARTHQLQTNISPSTAIILSKPADVQYFTGFSFLNPEEREAFVVVTAKTATLLYPSFSPVTKEKGLTYHAGYWPEDLKDVVTLLQKKESVTHCQVDTASLFVNEYQVLSTLEGIKITELDRAPIIQQRTAKEKEELAAIVQASSITKKTMASALKSLSVGVTERELAKKIELEMLALGAGTTAFPPVVAFGAHSALPHHQPTETALTEESVVLIDIGAKYNWYCSDMTRTVWFGKKPSEEFLKIESIIKAAYAAGIAEVRENCQGDEVDKVVRRSIEDAGYGETFIHTTGHGLGLEIHEQPSLYFKRSTVLPLNATVTIEPGIYLEGKFGYRFENTVVVTDTSCRELTA